MASENEVIVRQLIDAWNRRDMDAMLILADPGVEFVNAPQAVEPGTRRGHAEVARVFRTQWEFLADAVQVIDRVHDRGDEIITEAHVSRTMPGSDARFSNRILLSWEICSGRVVRLQVLGGGSAFDSARESAGLGS